VPRPLLTALAAAAVLAADQCTKRAARARLAPDAPQALLGEWIRLRRVENPGIAFGLLHRQPRLAALATALAPAMLLFLTRRVSSPAGVVGGGLVAGGWASNALDRARQGTVTDFLDLGLGRWRWPAFNLADAAIVLGVALLARGLTSGSPPRSSAPGHDALARPGAGLTGR